MYNEQYLSLAMNTLAARRQNSVSDLQRRREEVLKKCPEYGALEQSGISAGIHLAQTGKDDGALARIADRQEALLKENGFSTDYLQLRFVCPVCKDTGRVDGKLCNCVRELLKKYRREEINSTSPLSVCTFDSFSLQYYSACEDPRSHVVPREHMAGIAQFCRDYADNFGPGNPSVMIMGSAGLGKTHLALAIAGKALDVYKRQV